MRTTLWAVLGLILGFAIGETVAVLAGLAAGGMSAGTPPDPVLWFLRSLPILFAVAGAVATPLLARRRRSP